MCDNDPMTYLFIVAFIFVWVWVGLELTFKNFLGIVGAGAIGFACFAWGLNFVGGENFPMVKVYGWFFIGLGGLMALIVIGTIMEIVEDIKLLFTPEPVVPVIRDYVRVETHSKRHWGMHKQNVNKRG